MIPCKKARKSLAKPLEISYWALTRELILMVGYFSTLENEEKPIECRE